jgi:hypothetical protein
MAALGMGELWLAVGLTRMMEDSRGIFARLRYLVGISASLLLPGLGRFFFSDSVIVYLSSFVLMGGLILVFNYSKFFHPVKTDESR